MHCSNKGNYVASEIPPSIGSVQNPMWMYDSAALAYVSEATTALGKSNTVWPRITVVTPSFNSAKFIADTIESVRHQNYPNLQYIVSDSCSEDGTQDILAKYDFIDARIERDKGQSDALNRAFATAEGEILAWLNADDIYAPFTLHRMALEFMKGGADVVAGQVILFDETGPRLGHIYSLPDGPIIEKEIIDLDGYWLTGQYFYQPEVFFTKAIYEKAGGYIDSELYYSMDYDLWLRLSRAGATVRANAAPMAYFRVHEDQKTHDPNGFKVELRKYVAERKLGRGPDARRAGFTWSERQPRVAIINDLGFLYGAGIAHHRIAKAFGALGCEVRAFAFATDVNPENYKGSSDYELLFSDLIRFDPDFVIMGNLHACEREHGWVRNLLNSWPVFFVTHDFYWLTGRCAFPDSCTKFLDVQCNADCPSYFEYPALPPAEIRGAANEKAALVAHPNAFVLANSNYMERIVDSTLTKRDVQVADLDTKLQNAWLGAETDHFFLDANEQRQEAREKLGLPLGKTIVIFPSGDFSQLRKNPAAVLRIVAMLPADMFHAIFLGKPPYDERILPPNISVFPHTKDINQLSMLFRVSDFVFNASLAETFGQTVVEGALSGALPVSIGNGAVPEIIKALGAGFQASANKSVDDALEAALAYMTDLANNPDRLEHERLKCVLSASGQFTIEALARRLHIAIKMSGLIDANGLKPKADLYLTQAPISVLHIPEWAPDQRDNRVVELEARLNELQGEIDRILNSKSIRVTAPFRSARAALKRLFRI